MKIGETVRMNACEIHVEIPEGTASFKFRAPKGEVFVFLLMGVEPKDGSSPLHAGDTLRSWGWDREGYGTERPVIAGEGSRDEPSSSIHNEESQTNGS